MLVVILVNSFILQKKSAACNSSWINGYGAVSTFYRFSKTGKSTKLKRFDAIVNPKTSYKINNKKVSKKKYYAEKTH